MAALFQAAPALDADIGRAALTCRSAVVVEAESPSLTIATHFTYFTMTAARALPGSGNYFERMAAVPTPPLVPGLSRANARQVLAACDRRFPLARRTGPVTLPPGAVERDLMCGGAITVLAGMAGGYRERTGDAGPSNRLDPLATRFQQRADAGMAQRGISGADAQRRAVGDQILASLDVGNLEAVAAACEAQLRA